MQGRRYPFVIFALPVSQPCSILHSASSSGPAARCMQPSTLPPPKRDVLAALTIASMLIFVISFLIICNGMKHTPIRQINARVCSNIYLKCLIHSFQFFQNLLLCSANQPQLLSIHVFIFHPLNKLLNIGINSLGSRYLDRGINQFRQTENIILPPMMAYCSSLPLNHSLKLSIPVTIYLPPQFIQHFFHCFFNSFICVFSQCQRKLVYSISCGQFSWIVSPHLYGRLHLRILQAISHNIFPLRDSFCRITSDIRCVQHGILSQCRISAFQ